MAQIYMSLVCYTIYFSIIIQTWKVGKQAGSLQSKFELFIDNTGKGN